MAIWKESSGTPKDATPAPVDAATKSELDFLREPAPAARRAPSQANESVIGAEITFVGKIDGAGSVRVAGKFEGDVNIQGDLTIDAGAKLTGSVRAASVTIGGEIEGNIDHAENVEILSTGILNGDLKAGTLTVASGSRMRGRVEFGWGDEVPAKMTLGAKKVS